MVKTSLSGKSFQNYSHSHLLLLSCLVLFLVISSVGLFYISQLDQFVAHDVSATAGAQMQSLTTAYVATARAWASATAKTSASTTANANLNGTATAFIREATTTALVSENPYFSRSSMLTLDDSLKNNSGSNWDNNTDHAGDACAFSNGAYHVTSLQQHFIYLCNARATDFSNFTYQVQMTIARGDAGGVAFRCDTTRGTDYIFTINTTGLYTLYNYTGNSTASVLTMGFTSAIKAGLNQPNLLAIVVYDHEISLYVNKHYINSVNNNVHSHGAIAVVAHNDQNPTEVIYGNAKVWTLAR